MWASIQRNKSDGFPKKNSLFYRAFHNSTKSVSEIYDIVLISTFRNHTAWPGPPPGYVAYEKVVRLLYSYLLLHSGSRVGVAIARQTDDPEYGPEKLFHEQHLGDLVTIVPKSEDGMLGYLLTEKSNVVVSTSSALGLESLARGRKTLMRANHSFDIFMDQALSPDWALLRMDQETFNTAIIKLLAISQDDFLLRNKNSMKYFMVPSHENSISEMRKEVLG